MTSRSRPRQATTREHAARAREAAAARRQAARRRRTLRLAASAAVLVLAATVITILLTRSHDRASAGSRSTGQPPTRVSDLRATPAPWDAGHAQLAARLTALRLPASGDERYHIHAHLTIYVDGRAVPIPADIGLDEQAGVGSSMHTHEPDGVIHVEATQASVKFTLGAFFDVWGVSFGTGRLGGYSAHGPSTVHVYVNGKPVSDPASYRLRPHDDVVVGYGSDASFPHRSGFVWPAGE